MEGFKTIVDIKSDFNMRLMNMRNCIVTAGYNYETSKLSEELYSIWLQCQQFNSCQKYMLDINETSKRTKNVIRFHAKTYM